MTEAGWLACEYPAAMLGFLTGKLSARKGRLFACACARRLWPYLDSYLARQCVVVAEAFADGLADEFQMMKARQNATSRTGGRGAYESLQAMLACADVRPGLAFAAETSRLAIDAVGTGGPRHSWRDARSQTRQEGRAQCDLMRDLIANPFRPPAPALPWLNSTVRAVAQAADDERLPEGGLDPVRLAVLSDALEEAGCADADLLAHLRSPGPHVRGCWAIDLILGKE